MFLFRFYKTNVIRLFRKLDPSSQTLTEQWTVQEYYGGVVILKITSIKQAYKIDRARASESSCQSFQKISNGFSFFSFYEFIKFDFFK